MSFMYPRKNPRHSAEMVYIGAVIDGACQIMRVVKQREAVSGM